MPDTPRSSSEKSELARPTPAPGGYGTEGPFSISEVFLKSFACGLIEVDSGRRVRLYDAIAEELCGLERQAVLGESISALPGPLRDMLGRTEVREAEGLIRYVGLEFPAENETRWLRVELHVRGIDGDKGAPSLLVVLSNLSAIKNLERHVRRLDRLANIGTLSASAAHEIKNSLVAIKTFMDVVLAKTDEVEMSNLVRNEIRRIDTTASQLLKYSGPSRPSLAPISLHRVVANTLRLVQRQLEAKDIQLVERFEAGRDTVQADEAQLGQVFINLLLNAIHAISDGGEIAVTTTLEPTENSSDPDKIRVTVRDTGVGIPPENIRHLFNRFYTTKSEGTGLGLAITQRIVEEHGGEIDVESEYGRSTTFNIHLPLCPMTGESLET